MQEVFISVNTIYSRYVEPPRDRKKKKNGSIYQMFHLSELFDKWNSMKLKKKSTQRTSPLSDFSREWGIYE